MDRLGNISKLNLLIWLFPLLYFIHDLEEIFTVEKFLTKHADIIPFTVTTLQFTVAFFMLWLLTFVGCYKASKQQKFLGMKANAFFSFLVPGIFLANGIGHLIQFIVFKGYVPGILTSIFIIYPYSFFTLKYMLQKNILTTKRFLFFLFLGFILQGPFAFTALVVAKLLV
ncbi:HXXEE domain-containing protein [Microbacteriaceae bacterium 4G12]